VRGPRGKKLRGDESKAQHALPDDGKWAKGATTMRRRFKCDPKWIDVRYPARCAEPNCQTEINSGERAFYYPSDKALYGTRCGHGEKAERDFNAHRIDEDGF
jgi:hypothetical protein